MDPIQARSCVGDAGSQRGRRFDPACQVCHTTGYAGIGGFERMATSLDRRMWDVKVVMGLVRNIMRCEH